MSEAEAPAAKGPAPASPARGSIPQDAGPTAAGDGAEGEMKPKSASVGSLPVLTQDQIAAPPVTPKKTKKDFFVCIGLLILFLILCVVGIVVIKMVGLSGKEDLLRPQRQKHDVDHGVMNKDASPQ